MISASGPLPETAGELLPILGKDSLLAMGRLWGLDIKNRSKDQLVDDLAGPLFDPERIGQALQSLAPRERAALDLLVLNGGRLSVNALRGQLEAQGLVDPRPAQRGLTFAYGEPEGSAARSDSARFEDILARLAALGLAFPWPPRMGAMLSVKRPSSAVVIPAPVMPLLPSVALTIKATARPETVRPASPERLLRDLVTVLSAVRAEPIALTARGLIPKRSLVKLARLLSVPETDLGYPSFLAGLARAAGMIVAAGGNLTEAPRMGHFLQRPRGERLHRLYGAYAEGEWWCELRHIPSVTVRGTPYGPAIVQARRTVLDVLSRCPPGQWVDLDHLIDLLRHTSYEFLIPRERDDPYGYYAGYTFNPYAGANALGVTFSDVWEEGEGWNQIEGGFIRAMLLEPLFWFGMIDLGAPSPDGEPTAGLITEIGAALLRGHVPELPPLATHVVVQPNFQVFAFEPAGDDVIFTLDRLADRVSSQQTIEYRITRDSIYRAQQSGMEVQPILSFLAQVSTVPIPQNVRRSIEEWAAQNDRIVIRPGASLLQTEDEATLDALYARDDIAQLLGRRLTSTIALVSYTDLATLNTRLATGAGPVPLVSEGDDAQLGDAVWVADDGLITFRNRLPSVYVQRQVSTLAEPEAAGAYRLTRASLRRAARSMSPIDIIETLSHLQGASLSDGVTALIHQRTRDWGDAALAEVTLLQVDSAEILDALLGAPELRPFLHRLEGASTCALVSPDGRDTVRAALRDRGMDLRPAPVTAQRR